LPGQGGNIVGVVKAEKRLTIKTVRTQDVSHHLQSRGVEEVVELHQLLVVLKRRKLRT